jgi:hypothetical protein
MRFGQRLAVSAAVAVCLHAAASSAAARSGAASKTDPGADSRLRAARTFVERSDRYMHHSRLRRGMKGYGLTVFAGTRVERFGIEIVSVLTAWNPHRDVILARCTGRRLRKTGIVQGMSGSPIFVKDPDDGAEKMIGALAYGWSFQTEPVCGVQPITQMLAVSGMLPGDKPSRGGRRAAVAADPPRDAPAAYLRSVLDPRKGTFGDLARPKARRGGAAAGRPGRTLVPLAVPLMVSGLGEGTLAHLARAIGPAGLVPLRSGGVAAAEAKAARDATLQPGATIAIPLVTGDADWTAAGTVTDVIGEKVLAFGHPLYADGNVTLPMGPGYVHTVVSSQLTSFKLASTLKLTGTLGRDEAVGVGGRVGRRPPMIPLTVTVRRPDTGRRQVFRYRLAQDPWFTPLLVYYLVREGGEGWHRLPEEHTVAHEVTVQYAGDLGRYRAADVTSDRGTDGAASDAQRPVAAMTANPLGPRVYPRAVSVDLTISPGSRAAAILDLRLDGQTYRPGETVRGHLAVRPFRRERTTLPVAFELPADLPEGAYELTACDARTATSAEQAAMPQRFRPRTPAQLLAAIRRTVQRRGDRLYLRLPLPSGGLAVRTRELPQLPPSRRQILAAARPIDAVAFRRALERAVACEYLVRGSAAAAFTVRKTPAGTRLRGRED